MAARVFETSNVGDDQMPQPPFHLHLNRREVVASETPMTGLEILGLGDYGADYELYLLQGEGDPTGGELITHDRELGLKNGLHFRAIPGNANFGSRDR
jgi:hypothetical protein